VLVIQLKRTIFDLEKKVANKAVKNSSKITFDQQLDLDKVEFGQSCSYELRAFINHSGSAGRGHYTARIKDGQGWCECNDATHTRLLEYSSDLDGDEVFMLFYRKIESHPKSSSSSPSSPLGSPPVSPMSAAASLVPSSSSAPMPHSNSELMDESSSDSAQATGSLSDAPEAASALAPASLSPPTSSSAHSGSWHLVPSDEQHIRVLGDGSCGLWAIVFSLLAAYAESVDSMSTLFTHLGRCSSERNLGTLKSRSSCTDTLFPKLPELTHDLRDPLCKFIRHYIARQSIDTPSSLMNSPDHAVAVALIEAIAAWLRKLVVLYHERYQLESIFVQYDSGPTRIAALCRPETWLADDDILLIGLILQIDITVRGMAEQPYKYRQRPEYAAFHLEEWKPIPIVLHFIRSNSAPCSPNNQRMKPNHFEGTTHGEAWLFPAVTAASSAMDIDATSVDTDERSSARANAASTSSSTPTSSSISSSSECEATTAPDADVSDADVSGPALILAHYRWLKAFFMFAAKYDNQNDPRVIEQKPIPSLLQIYNMDEFDLAIAINHCPPNHSCAMLKGMKKEMSARVLNTAKYGELTDEFKRRLVKTIDEAIAAIHDCKEELKEHFIPQNPSGSPSVFGLCRCKSATPPTTRARAH